MKQVILVFLKSLVLKYNKKAIKWSLILCTMVIWVFVFIKLVESQNSVVPVESEPIMKLTSNDEIVIQDTIYIEEGFLDPFRPTKNKRITKRIEKSIEKPSLNQKIVKSEIDEIAWPHVEYSGRMVNRSKNIVNAIVKMGSKTFIVQPPEEKGGITFLKAFQDSIICEFRGDRKTINLVKSE